MRSAGKQKNKTKTLSFSDDQLCNIIKTYRQVSEDNRRERADINSFNWDMYNLKQDWSHKTEDQSTEFIPKLANAAEHLTSLIQTGITSNSDDWFTVDDGNNDDNIFDTDTVFNLMQFYLKQIKPAPTIAAMAKTIGMNSRLCVKVSDNIVKIERFVPSAPKKPDIPKEPPAIDPDMEGQIPEMQQQMPEQEDNVIDLETFKNVKKEKIGDKNKITIYKWRPKIEVIDFIDHYPDPFPSGDKKLYDIHEYTMDLHELKNYVKEYPEGFNTKTVSSIKEHFIRREQQEEKESNQNKSVYEKNYANRKKVTITEFYGTILDESGETTDKYTECFIIMVNDKHIIKGPDKYDSLDGERPFVDSTLIDIPNSLEGKGFLDATARLNATLNESYNLLLDGELDEIMGVKQVREDMLKDPNQIANGVRPGDVLRIQDDVPANVEVYTKCKTGSVPPDAMNMHRYTEEITNESSYMNELKLGGMPPASTKATVASLSDQAISGVFTSIIKQYEDKCVTPLLRKIWLKILQKMDDETLIQSDLIALIGKEKALRLLRMSPEERYLRGANAAEFTVRGISGYVQKMRDFQKFVNLLQTIGSSPMLFEKFAQGYSIEKLLKQLLTASGLREEQLRLNEKERIMELVRQMQAKAIFEAQQSNKKNPPQQGAGPQPPMDNSQPITNQGPQGPMEGNANALFG